MKRLFSLLLFAVLLFTAAITHAQNFVYAGRFYLRSAPPIAHNVDIFLLNHLSVEKGDAPEGYIAYDVYYNHDHASDTGDYSADYANQSFRFRAKIVPLNIYNEPMGEGLFAGTINCDFIIAAQGVYGIRVENFSVTDTENGERLFFTSGDMGSEQLFAQSAAEAILKLSGDHPVDGGKIDRLGGVGFYPFR